ncbi:hypothetical protein EOD39_5641 [Acipenser ruthenus]|uniref:Uncharacterized protein n=1 Tax=Acipenser ruthenus TaxID=7906 RepID=A0A444UDB1_ACIRT|nr:hypothetical protein EOD39_5641 [Acipenser ruthenus]
MRESSGSFPVQEEEEKSHWSKRLVDSEQLEKLWAVVSHRCSACPPCPPPVPLEQQEAINTDWQQDDMLSIAASKEVGEMELAFPSEEVDSDSTLTAVNLCRHSFCHLLRGPLKNCVPWPTDEIRNQSIFEDEPAPSPVSQDYS